MAYSKTFTTRNFPAGLVADGTLFYRVVDDANATLVARTNAGITETADPITGLPTYSVTVTLQETWSGRLLWDLFEAQWDEESFSAVTNAPTRTIEFLYETGDPPTPSDTSPAGVAVTSVIVNDVREAATNTLLNAGPFVMTHAGVGRWTLDAVAIGIDPSVAIYYAAAVVYADATTEQYPHLYDAGLGVHYSSEPLVRAKAGTTNASALTAWADFENNRDPAEISADIDAKLTEADDRVNLKLLTYGVALPFVAPNDYVRAQVKRAATLYTLGFIIKAREDLAAPTNPNQPTPGDSLIVEGDEILDALAKAGSLTVDTSDDVLVADAPVAVGATVDANGCDLPDPDVCPCNGNLWPVYRVWR